MKSIFKLSLLTAVNQKLGFLMLVLAVIVPMVLPMLTNYEVDSYVVEPARAQAAWQFGWLACVLWLLFQAASAGGEYVKSGLGSYFTSGGQKKGNQLTALWASSMVFGALLCLVPAIVSVVAASPGLEIEARHWAVLSIQHFILMLLVVSSLVMLAISLASRFGTTVGYIFTLGLAYVGFFGVTTLEKIVAAKDIPVLDLLYGILPHLYLADLTHRFVHKQGALTTGQLMTQFEYLAGWAMLFTAVSLLIFSPKQK